MIEEKYIELMNREIDGLNSPRESAELEKRLRKDPEAQRYYRELRFVTGALDRVPEIEPPPELKESILRSIFGDEAGAVRATQAGAVTSGARARTAAGHERRAATVLDVFRIGWRPRFAYVLAACAAVSVFLFVLFWRVVPGRAPRDLEALYGSIVAKQQVGQLLAVQPIEVALPGIQGQLHVRYEKKRILAALDLRSDSRIQVMFGYAKEVSFESITALNDCQYNAKAGDGTLELTHSGDCRYVIVLEDKGGTHSPVALKIMREGSLLLEQATQPAQER